MKDVELKEVDQAKQLMTREINGCVKVTVPENTGVKYGLSKDELIKIAGTAGYANYRRIRKLKLKRHLTFSISVNLSINLSSADGFGLVGPCWFCSGLAGLAC